jgi:hypothetical protein
MRVAYYSRYNRKNPISTAGKQITWGMGVGVWRKGWRGVGGEEIVKGKKIKMEEQL